MHAFIVALTGGHGCAVDMFCSEFDLRHISAFYYFIRHLRCSLIPSLYSSLKSEGHSFVSDDVVSLSYRVLCYMFLC